MKVIIILVLFAITSNNIFAQKDCKKCDIEKIIIVDDNIKKLSFLMVKNFLCTIDEACRNNVEFSEYSNELLFKVLETDPNLFFSVLEQEDFYNQELILEKIQHPIHDGINLQNVYNKIKGSTGQKNLKDKFLKALKMAM